MTVQALNEYRQELRQAEEAEPNRLKDTSMPTPPWLDSPDTAAAASNMLQPPWASVDEPMPRADVALKGTVDAFDRNHTHFLDAVMNVRACVCAQGRACVGVQGHKGRWACMRAEGRWGMRACGRLGGRVGRRAVGRRLGGWAAGRLGIKRW